MLNINFSNQNKLVIIGLITSTVLIFLIGFTSVMTVQTKIEKSFSAFGEITAKTLAEKSISKYEILKRNKNMEKYLSNYSKLLINNNDDIANTATSIENTVKDSIVAVFVVAWVIFAITMIINSVLISRELNILHHGVRQISGGKFGYQLNGRGVSGNIKSLIEAFNNMSERLHR